MGNRREQGRCCEEAGGGLAAGFAGGGRLGGIGDGGEGLAGLRDGLGVDDFVAERGESAELGEAGVGPVGVGPGGELIEGDFGVVADVEEGEGAVEEEAEEEGVLMSQTVSIMSVVSLSRCKYWIEKESYGWIKGVHHEDRVHGCCLCCAGLGGRARRHRL